MAPIRDILVAKKFLKISVISCSQTFLGCLLYLEIASEVQVRRYGRFLEEYTSQLKEIETVLDESSGDCWDLFLDPLSLEVILLDDKVFNRK
jgi:hypothetical protein